MQPMESNSIFRSWAWKLATWDTIFSRPPEDSLFQAGVSSCPTIYAGWFGPEKYYIQLLRNYVLSPSTSTAFLQGCYDP